MLQQQLNNFPLDIANKSYKERTILSILLQFLIRKLARMFVAQYIAEFRKDLPFKPLIIQFRNRQSIKPHELFI